MYKAVLMSTFYSSVVVPIVLVGNKKDLDTDTDVTLNVQLIFTNDCEAVARTIGAFAYLECSAKLNRGVKEVFEMAFRAFFPANKRNWFKKKIVMVI